MDARTADSDEEDSDYVPEPDNDDNEGNGQEQRKLTGMTSSRKRKVDSIFEEMQSEDKKELDSRMMRSFSSSKSKGEGGSRVGKSSKKRRDEAILASIFGREVGKKISSASSFAVGSCSTTKANGEELKRRALASAKAVLKKTKVTETRKFAGKEIRIERTVMAERSSAKGESSAAKEDGRKRPSEPAGGGGGLDSVLDTLKGPKVVSTVAKSSVDWDNFKEEKGLDEDLSTAAKDGYLTRKDFLERCDVRTYEVEKTVRSAAGGSSSAGGGGRAK